MDTLHFYHHAHLSAQVHDALGLNLAQKHGFAIGAAAVSPETVRFFLSLDMKLLEMISQARPGHVTRDA